MSKHLQRAARLLLTLLFWSLVVFVATRQVHAQVKYHAKGEPVYVQPVDTNKYPIYFHVRSVAYAEPCSMVLSGSDGSYYSVYSHALNCRTFDPGTGIMGRLTTFWGQHLIELAWQGDRGKPKTCKYFIGTAAK